MSPSPFLAEIDPSLVRVLGEKPASLGFGADDVPPEAKKYKKGTETKAHTPHHNKTFQIDCP